MNPELERLVRVVLEAREETQAALRNIKRTRVNLEVAERSARYADAAALRAYVYASTGKGDAAFIEVRKIKMGMERMIDEMSIAFERQVLIPIAAAEAAPKATTTWRIEYRSKLDGPASVIEVMAPDYPAAVEEVLRVEPRALQLRPREWRTQKGAWRRADWLPGFVKV